MASSLLAWGIVALQRQSTKVAAFFCVQENECALAKIFSGDIASYLKANREKKDVNFRPAYVLYGQFLVGEKRICQGVLWNTKISGLLASAAWPGGKCTLVYKCGGEELIKLFSMVAVAFYCTCSM